MNCKSTKNGRKESYEHLPMPCIAGKDKYTDIIKSLEYVFIYAVNFSGKEVDITLGNFIFFTSGTYTMKNSKILYSIKGVILIGSGLEIIQFISVIGDNVNIDSRLVFYSKNGQTISVDIG
ncbi:metallopeptidase TldD-related protein [Buchnera aphidicola]|uniref:metallopeptidase TldD-related protein n=1 Tax=Buchnera aphidicola TaxID=9 RepID=UPI0012AB7626|nr:metallopeptidase TldD-related protein [Buchnera aphidicola]